VLLALKANERYIKRLLYKTDYYHRQSLKAKSMGHETAYKKINWLANEEFGKSFFTLMAMGMGSLWPVFFGGAWLNERFGQMTFIVLPQWMGGYHINFIGPFVALYIGARYTVSKSKPHLKRLFLKTGETPISPQ